MKESEFRKYTNLLVGGKILSENSSFKEAKIQDLSVTNEKTFLYGKSESLIWGKLNLLFKMATDDGSTVEEKPMWFVVNQIEVDYLTMPDILGASF